MRDALIAIAAVAILVVGGMVWLAERTHLESPKLSMNGPAEKHGPDATELMLAAGGVDACSGGGQEEVDDVEVRETSRKVVVEASLRVDEPFPFPPCEIRTAHASFVVSLDGPLGTRLVLDNSGDDLRVIWSPEIRKGALRAKRVTRQDAESFLLSKRAGSDAECIRLSIRYWGCSYRRADTGRIAKVNLTVDATGQLMLGLKRTPLP